MKPLSYLQLFSYWGGFAFVWMLLTYLAWRLCHRTTAPGRTGLSVAAVLAVALAAHFAAALSTWPVLSDDIWRYVLDGSQLGMHGENPYRAAPQNVEHIWPVNYPGLVTVYQPTSQWVFAGLAQVTNAMFARPLAVLEFEPAVVFRLGFAGFSLCTTALLMVKLLRENRSPWWAALWAWHPLAVSEVAWSGHQDVIGIAWLIMTLTMTDWLGQGWVVRRSAAAPASSAGKDTLIALGAGAAFALAVGVKPLVVPLALPLAWSLRRQPRMLVLAVCATAATLMGLYLPFALADGGLGGMIDTVGIFMADWAFNSSLHAPLADVMGKTGAGAVLACILLALLIWATVAFDAWRAGMVYLFAALLLSSTAHPWYLLWALALLPVRFNAALWVLSLTISASYVALVDLDVYRVPPWVKCVEYVPVYALIGWQAVRLFDRDQRTGLG